MKLLELLTVMQVNAVNAGWVDCTPIYMPLCLFPLSTCISTSRPMALEHCALTTGLQLALHANAIHRNNRSFVWIAMQCHVMRLNCHAMNAIVGVASFCTWCIENKTRCEIQVFSSVVVALVRKGAFKQFGKQCLGKRFGLCSHVSNWSIPPRGFINETWVNLLFITWWNIMLKIFFDTSLELNSV